MAERSHPTGSVTFLFTDIEGSTRLWDAHRDSMAVAVAGHDELLRGAIETHDGYVFKTIGDAFCGAFQSAANALEAAVAIQRELAERRWDMVGELRVRVALHIGEAEERNADYFGPTVNRVARLLAAGHGGQVLLSAAAVEALTPALPAELQLRDLGHRRLKDLTQPERIHQLVIPGLPDAFPPLKSLDARPNNLPVQPTPLLGREEELAEVKTRLRGAGTRVLTLTGPGGTGKTRLSLQAAADLIDDFPHGVWFVDLSAVTEPELVTSEIARALDVREEGGSLAEQLRGHLRERELLLVLDNFEQVLPAAKQVATLLGFAPKVKMLVTSRAPLRIAGEAEYPVPPLPLPDPKHVSDVAHLEAFPSVELFVERASAVRPGFALTAENARAVSEICVALDGLPLAIELAAARSRVLSPQALLSRLSDRLALLTGGGRDRAERQQTLRGAIAWSHDLLGPDEQTLFRRLAVFAGGFTLEAGEAVEGGETGKGSEVGEGGDGGAEDVVRRATSPSLTPLAPLLPPSTPLFDVVAGLVEQSLLRQEEGADGEPRFRMLATIREFALEQMEASGDADALRRTHAAYFLALAETAEPELTGPKQGMWLDTLETEHDNLRAALAWAQGAGDVQYGLRLSATLAKFWQVHGHLTEGRRWLEHALEADRGCDPVPRMPALLGAGRLANAQGDYEGATGWLEEALALVETTSDTEKKASIVNQLAHIAVGRGHLERAEVLYTQSLALCEQMENRSLQAKVLGNLGAVAQYRGESIYAVERYESQLEICRELQDNEGMALALYNLITVFTSSPEDRGKAQEYGEESLRLARELGDKAGEAYALLALSVLAQTNGDLDESVALHSKSLELFREIEDLNGEATVLGSLGLVISDRGGHLMAAMLIRDSLRMFAEIGDRAAVVLQLESLACVAVWLGESHRAACLFGAAEALRNRIGLSLPEELLARYEAANAQLRIELDEEVFQTYWQEGRSLDDDEAVAMGLATESIESTFRPGMGY